MNDGIERAEVHEAWQCSIQLRVLYMIIVHSIVMRWTTRNVARACMKKKSGNRHVLSCAMADETRNIFDFSRFKLMWLQKRDAL